jgi:hypothetical protein
MRMTPEEYRQRFPDRPPPVPLEYAGQRLAWNEDHTEILALGSSIGEVRDGAARRGCNHPVFQRIPRGRSSASAYEVRLRVHCLSGRRYR